MRIFITGITGQDGPFLAEAAIKAGHEVWGLVRGQNNPKAAELAVYLPEVRQLHGDLLDAGSIDRAVSEARPDAIVNLGAMTYIPTSWEQPELAVRTIVEGTLNVLNAAVRHGVRRVVQASTSEMFGNGQGTKPQIGEYIAHPDLPGRGYAELKWALDEQSPMLPASPYGTAKLAAHHLCRNYRTAYGLSAVSAIMFNHESPRRSPIFVTRKITQGVAAICTGLAGMLELGTLDASRDWGWAPEYMEALLLLCDRSDPDESYVIATGETATVGDFVAEAFALVGRDWRGFVRLTAANKRASEVWTLRGDPSKIADYDGWRATKHWREVCALMLAHDLRDVGAPIPFGVPA